MIIKTIKTKKILPKKQSIFALLDESLPPIRENSIVAITSKIIALCEGRVASFKDSDKTELVRKEADFYLPSSLSKYSYTFTIKNNTLTSLAGIDESNAGDSYVLWPKDSQKSANAIRKYLKEKYALSNVGTIITDSTCMPLRWGTVGQALSYSGFKAVNDYVGKEDLFGKPFQVSRAGIATGLAASAVLNMGEGTEQTPIAIIEDAPFIEFQDRNPTKEELELFYLKDKDEDLFAPFLNAVNWHKGSSNDNPTVE